MEAIHQVRSAGQSLKVVLRAHHHRLQFLSNEVQLRTAQPNLAAVQLSQPQADACCDATKSLNPAVMREELAEIHPRVKVIEDESRLPRQQRYRPGEARLDDYLGTGS